MKKPPALATHEEEVLAALVNEPTPPNTERLPDVCAERSTNTELAELYLFLRRFFYFLSYDLSQDLF
jgi:hypothetical protein